MVTSIPIDSSILSLAGVEGRDRRPRDSEKGMTEGSGQSFHRIGPSVQIEAFLDIIEARSLKHFRVFDGL